MDVEVEEDEGEMLAEGGPEIGEEIWVGERKEGSVGQVVGHGRVEEA